MIIMDRLAMREGHARVIRREAQGASLRGGVLMYHDAFGLRPAMAEMGARLAAMGYAVLIPDLFNRFGDHGPHDAKTGLVEEASKQRLMGMIRGTSQAMTSEDLPYFLNALDELGATGPLAVIGYCQGGARALTSAAMRRDRFVAAASLHGGNLASDAPDSPHLLAENITARLYIGTAAEDASFPEAQSTLLAASLRKAGVDFTLESYRGVQHGWTVPDSRVFDARAAERHWTRITALLAECMG